jgi:hypothetical protein
MPSDLIRGGYRVALVPFERLDHLQSDTINRQNRTAGIAGITLPDSRGHAKIDANGPDSDIERLPSVQVARHWQWTPEIGRGLAVPGLWSPRNHLNREDGNESSFAYSKRNATIGSSRAARWAG